MSPTENMCVHFMVKQAICLPWVKVDWLCSVRLLSEYSILPFSPSQPLGGCKERSIKNGQLYIWSQQKRLLWHVRWYLQNGLSLLQCTWILHFPISHDMWRIFEEIKVRLLYNAPCSDFATAMGYVMNIPITEEEKSGRLVKKYWTKNSFPLLYSSVFACRRELGVWWRPATWQGWVHSQDNWREAHPPGLGLTHDVSVEHSLFCPAFVFLASCCRELRRKSQQLFRLFTELLHFQCKHLLDFGNDTMAQHYYNPSPSLSCMLTIQKGQTPLEKMSSYTHVL